MVHAPHDPLGPFAIVGGSLHVPDAGLAAAVEEGARAELSRAGELATGGGVAAIEVELLRVDETSEGVAIVAPNLPLARAVRVTARGRARLRRPGVPSPERDTGDVSAGETVARTPAAAAALVVSDEAGRAAARRLGALLVRRLLGFPEPGEP